MKPEVKTLWLSALRSGRYPKARGKLRTDDGFCCYGVLCELASQAGIVTWRNGGYGIAGDTKDWRRDFLPASVALWAGLDQNNLVFSDLIIKGIRLSAYNDGIGTPMLSFPEIADLIERHV